MTIHERFHAILLKIEEILHLHPTNTTAIAAKQAEVAALTSHPDVPPETAAVIASASASAAAAESPIGGQMPTVLVPAAPAATEPAPTPAP